ncbi:hypothetical protein BDV23DRAFT_188836 [Aspergillus alliaceus]|uniref:Uncharacterized protein n=1 Tax=Petromyces alliaceus TaxID=209559 RepID=A0A5N7BSQ4_PETAA|nr:hypothetical protein BDV23DRAFT_188836 [Aspergillus alliaceus]
MLFVFVVKGIWTLAPFVGLARFFGLGQAQGVANHGIAVHFMLRSPCVTVVETCCLMSRITATSSMAGAIW